MIFQFWIWESRCLIRANRSRTVQHQIAILKSKIKV